MAFIASSQHRAWTFSSAGLDALRGRVCNEAESRRLAASAEVGSESSGATGPPAKRARILDEDAATGSAASGQDASRHTALSQADQLRLVRLCCRDVIRICKEAHFDRAIMATAVAFLQRFYLSCALTENSPASFVHTAVFLAIKAEACPYTEVEPFSRRLAAVCSLTDGQLVGHEVPLLMGLQYTLTVHHAYRPLRALLAAVVGEYMAQADAQARAAGAAGAAGAVVSAAAASSDASHSPVATPSPIPTAGGAGAGSSAGSGSAGLLSPEDPSFVAAWDALQGRAFALVDVSLATDAPFLYTPAQVAAACLLLAARTDTLPAAAADASSAAGSSHAGGGAPQLHSAMARQLLAKAHSHGAPSSASSLTCAADVAATSMQSDGPGDDRARALPSAERGHHAAALGLGWWDDSALLTSAPAAVASFVEPCVRRMIAAEAAAAAAPAAAAVGLAAAAHEAAEEAAEAAAVAAAEAAAAQALDLDAGDADAAEAAAPSTAAVKTRKGRAGARAAAIDAVTGERLSRAAAQLLAGIDHAATLVHEALSDSVKACQEGLPWQQELSGLLQKLSESMSPASLPGTVAYAQRLAAAKDVRVAYKAEKAASRAAASKMAADSDVSGGVA